VNLQTESDLSGVIEPNFLIGRTAVELVASMLQMGEHGIPSRPILQLIDGTWNEGRTIRHIYAGGAMSGLKHSQKSAPKKTRIGMF
jgi:hypothetical protein